MSPDLRAVSKSALKRSGYKTLPDRKRYQLDIVAFAEEVFNIKLAPYQKEILRGFLAFKRFSVRAPHGAGKTALSAIIILWAISCLDVDVKVITTASSWRQLINYTWPEVHKWASRGDWAKCGVQLREGQELSSLTLKIGDRRAFAAASNKPVTIEGAHATLVIVIFDESKGIPAPMWDALEGAFSTGDAYAFAISTPGDPSGRFYDIHKRRRGYEEWSTRHVTIEECINAGRIKPDWVEQRKAQWGPESAVYQNRVLANFAESSEDAVIPLSWIEAAVERWDVCEGVGEGRITYGVDPGGSGSDPTEMARLVGVCVEWLEGWHSPDQMESTGKVVSKITKEDPIGVDVIGLGAGMYSRLAELGYAARPVNVAEGTEFLDATGQNKFSNLRSYLWWSMREALDPNLKHKLALPNDDELTGELTAPTYKYQSHGAIQVESKKELRSRLGRSTNKADAVALAWYVAAHRGLTPEDIERLRTGTYRPEVLSEQLLGFMKRSGVELPKS